MAIDLRSAFKNEPPVLDFIWPGFLAGTVGALVAPGATGKSFWALEAAMSIACSVAGGDLIGLAERVERGVSHIKQYIKIAVMGCEVNGPGEAKDADIGVSCGKHGGLIFMRGE
ncbi:MAG: flavodoxin-dependent (E)-4-hydroxy-3-methylbut-2-enyl-diphosphate synthase, partial [Azoarcus sp.]|nr:flavodoxin-dependent (E)-4-hydroxy-3-methylbut-2-enyl-diphosphate synthase [Azoarcus sp.]